MKRGDFKTITIVGENVRAEYLGKGHYSTAYRVGDVVYLFTKNDPMKDAYVKAWSEGYKNLPETHYVGTSGLYTIYSMTYYENVKSANKEAWSIFRLLEKIREETIRDLQKMLGNSWNPEHDAHRVMASMLNDYRVPDEIKPSLERLYTWATTWGAGTCFEFAPRNLGVDTEGNIIFRDILFDWGKLYRKQMEKWKYVQAWRW